MDGSDENFHPVLIAEGEIDLYPSIAIMSVSNPPVGKNVVCPECNAEAMALVPKGSAIVKREGNADGKVWVTCETCGNRFLVHFQTA